MTSQRLTSIITTSSRENLAENLRKRYSPSALTGEYNIDLQVIAMSACPTIDLCADVKSPMLSTLAQAYPAAITPKGEKVESTAITWMQAHLVAVSKYVKVKMKMSDWQMNALCQQLIADYPHITMMEFILFCARLRSGQYGSFYGSIDPLLISHAFARFMEDRNQDYGRRYERDRKVREEREAEESRRNSISWADYCKENGIEGRESPLDGKKHFEAKPEIKDNPEEILKTAKWVIAEKDENTRESFIRFFKKKHGCSPEDYIKKHSVVMEEKKPIEYSPF